MPVVQQYGTQQVQRDLPSGNYRDTSVVPGSFGQGLAEAGEQLGQSAFNAADHLATIQTDAQVSNVAAQYHQAATDAIVQWQQDNRGYAAEQNLDQIKGKLAQLRSQYGSQLATPLGQRMFADQANSAETAFNSTIVSHAASERYDADVSGFKAKTANAQNDFVNAGGEGPAAEEAMTRAEQGLVGLQHLTGVWGGPNSAEVAGAQLRALRTQMHSAVVDSMLDKSGTGGTDAYAYLQAHAKDIDPVTYAQLSAKVSQQVATTSLAPVALAAVAGNLKDTPAGAVATSSVGAQVAAAAQAKGYDPQRAVAVAQLESGLRNIGNPKSSAQGVFQFTDGTWASMGGTDANRGDVAAQIDKGLDNLAQNDRILTANLGRAPTPAETYLAQQQGAAGATALLTAGPQETAVQALTDAGVSEAEAKRRIALNGGQPGMLAKDFVSLWSQKMDAAMGAGAQGGAFAANGVPAPGSGRLSLEEARASAAAYAAQHFPNNDYIAKSLDAQVVTEYRRQSSEDRQKRAQAFQTVSQIAQNGGAWTDVPADVRADLLPTQIPAAQAMFSQGGYAKASDPVVLAGLNKVYAENPQAFAHLDLTTYAPKLQHADYDQLLKEQTQIAQGVGPTKERQVTVGTIMSTSHQLLTSAGLIRGNGSAPDPATASKVAQFQAKMLNWSQAYQAQTGKPPDSKAIHDQADAFLIQGFDAQDTGVLGTGIGRATHFAFETAPGHSFQPNIPDDVRKQLTSELTARLKRAPNANEINNAYRRAHAAGLVN